MTMHYPGHVAPLPRLRRPAPTTKRRAQWEHGTTYGYNRKRCRCEACTKANREHQRQWRERALRGRGVDE